MALSVEVAEESRGQPGGVPRPALLGRVYGGRDQAGPLAVQPRQRLGRAWELRDGRGWCGDARPTMTLGWERCIHRDRRGVQVVIE